MTKSQINKALGELQSLQETANTAGEAYAEACQELGGEIEAYTSEKSDRWQEGAAGEAYNELQSELENMEVEVPEVPDFNV